MAPHEAKAGVPAAAPPATEHWRRNVVAISASQFTAKFGFAFMTPFLPLFLSRELGVRDPRQLALWVGLVAGGAGIGLAAASPIWGAVADRYGRKQMLARAMVGGAIFMALTALVMNPVQLIGTRLLLGAVAGTTAAATALIAAETPRAKVGSAIGTLTSAQSIGQAVGPLVGGLLGAVIGLRQLVALGGLMILLPVWPLVKMVRETTAVTVREKLSIPQALRNTDPANRLAIGVLVLSQGLVQCAYFSATQLAAVRIVEVEAQHAAIATGVAFTAVGLAASAAAVSYSLISGRFRLRLIAVVAAALMTAAVFGISTAHGVTFLIPAIAGVGFSYGALTPAIASMIGLEAPGLIKATVFGLSASAGAIGMAVGPPSAGVVAGLYGVPAGLYTAALASLLIALLLSVWGREPQSY